MSSGWVLSDLEYAKAAADEKLAAAATEKAEAEKAWVAAAYASAEAAAAASAATAAAEKAVAARAAAAAEFADAKAAVEALLACSDDMIVMSPNNLKRTQPEQIAVATKSKRMATEPPIELAEQF